MKSLSSAASLILIISIAVACRKVDVETTVERSTSPTPALSAAPSLSAPLNSRRAPEGVFFLLERVSVTTDSGVIGFAPRTRVRMVENKGGKCQVTDGTTTFEVLPTQLTDDVDLGTLAARQDNASQQALADYMRRQNEAYRQQQESEKKWLDEQDRRVAQRRKAAALAQAREPNPLDRGPYNQTYSFPYWWYPYRYYHGYRVYVDQRGQHYWIDGYGQWHYLP